jgi:hypothetical protein
LGIVDACSSKVTLWPALLSDQAIERPAMPAPTTMMFMKHLERIAGAEHTVWLTPGKTG